MKADMRCEILIPYKLWWTTDVDCDERVFSEYLQRLFALSIRKYIFCDF